jgi:alkylation response protein AidB-like acyl-CoA dehydrogenase
MTVDEHIRAEERLRTGGYAAIVEAATRLRDEFAERADAHDRSATYAFENIARVWEEGLGNLTLPASVGGVGADLRSSAAAIQLLAMGDPSTALILVMHLLHMHGVVDGGDWPEELRAQIVADSLAGPALINSLRVEPELGTPARGGIPATRAHRTTTGDGRAAWRISGHKIYSTGSLGLRYMNVWGATADDDPDGVRVGPFLVPASSEGIEIVETWDHLGMRGSASHDVIFHDVVIPFENAIGLREPSEQRPPSPVQSVWMTILIVSIYDGVARAARDWLVGYLNERTPSNLGAPLASLERFQSAVGEIEALLYTNARLIEAAIADADAGGDAAANAARRIGLLKVVVTGNVVRAIEQGLRLIGNPGLSYHNPLQRYYRDALCSRIHTPQDDAVLTAVGKAELAR